LESHHLEPEAYTLWAELAPVVGLFQRCLTQWRPGPIGVIGLDYVAVLQIAGLVGLEMTAAIMQDIQTMELHARDLINRKAGGN
jgi:hypothetical protein